MIEILRIILLVRVKGFQSLADSQAEKLDFGFNLRFLPLPVPFSHRVFLQTLQDLLQPLIFTSEYLVESDLFILASLTKDFKEFVLESRLKGLFGWFDSFRFRFYF